LWQLVAVQQVNVTYSGKLLVSAIKNSLHVHLRLQVARSIAAIDYLRNRLYVPAILLISSKDKPILLVNAYKTLTTKARSRQ